MKRKLLLLFSMFAYFAASALSLTYTDSNSGDDSDPVVSSITFGIIPGSTITDVQITATIGDYCPSWYSYTLEIAGNEYTGLCNTTNDSYSDLNGVALNGQIISITSVDEDAYSDGITLSLSVTVFYDPPAGAPGVPSNPNPADGATDAPANGNLTWDFGTDTDTYDLWFGEAGNMTEVVSDATASGTGSYTYSSLTTGTDYEWKVVGTNSSGSTTGDTWSFTVPCEAISSFPYTEGFEDAWVGSPAAPQCWSQITVSGTNVWNQSTTTPHSGTYCAKAPWASAGGEHLLITPGLSFGTTDYRLKFWLKGSSSGGTDLKVQIADDNSSAGNFTTELAYYIAGTNMPTTWTEYIIDLSAYEDVQYIAFRMIDDDGYSLYIDDVTVEEIPSCTEPTDLTSTTETTTGADLGWTDASGSHWDLYIVATGDPAPDAGTDPTINDITANPYTWTGGTAATTYDWYARSDCGQDNTDVSPWTGPDSFTTECIAVDAFTEDFDAVTIPDFPICWAKVGAGGAASTQSTSSSSSPNCLYMYSGSTSSLAVVKTKPVTNLGDGTHRLKLKMRANFTVGGIIEVGYLTDPTDATTFNALGTLTASSLTYTDFIFTPVAGSYSENLAFRHTGSPANSLLIDDVVWEAIPSTPVFTISPVSKDFGSVPTGETSAAQTFTISNTGAGTLQITGTALSGTDADQFTLIDLNTYPIGLTNGQSITIDVTFDPTSDGAKTASLDITDDQGGGTHTVPLTGTGFTPPQGSICSNPLLLTLPAVDVTGNTVDYGDDYSSADISPTSNYLNGDDVVYQFTVNAGTLTGTITTTGTWIGAFVLADCPNPTSPPTPVIQKTSSGNSLTFFDDIAAGTYFLIISSYPSPQSIDYNINLSLTEHPASATWTGATDTDWTNAANWSGAEVPGFTTNVTIPAGSSNYPTLLASAKCNNLTIESSATGSGSLLGQNYLTVNGTTTIERYATAGTWHGISGPLDNDDFNSLYFGGSPNVWGMTYHEATNDYDYVTDLNTDLGDAKGWMVWIGGSTAQTFEFTGDLRKSAVGPVALTNTLMNPNYGYNFIGNPYPSTIDWDVIEATLTNVGSGIWVWNPNAAGGPDFATYITGGSSTNGGSKDIALGQGFFVQLAQTEATGSITIPLTSQEHASSGFMKNQQILPSNYIKLKLTDAYRTDESIIRLDAQATEGYDLKYDMHKLFSWDEEQPQLYSTDNNFMAINALPPSTVSVPMDVRGVDGNEMTISLEAVSDFDHVYLSDDFTGVQTELTEQPYTFVYDASQTDRFTIYFTIVSTTENALDNIRVYGFDKQVRLEIPMQVNVNVEVVNMLGQTVRNMDAHMGTTDIHLDHGGYYLVKITGDNQRVTRKVFIR